ncbi:hypothetical protein [Terriglobus roseus]|uniref:hypothetical protein n=1 Tax=Terriglobus roseus TaxID=392734 RepID=UPI0012E99F22|nr:hypothetical protein [Terriglobus roseus]
MHLKSDTRWVSREETTLSLTDLLSPLEADEMTADLTGNKRDEMLTESNEE